MSGTVPTLPSLQARLADAQVQQHKLLTGQGIAQITDRNGEMVRYSLADQDKLASYIGNLQYMIANGLTDAAPVYRTPIHFAF